VRVSTFSRRRAPALGRCRKIVLASRSRPHWLGRWEFRKAAGDAPSAIVVTARVDRHWRALRRRAWHCRVAVATASHELCFPSALAGHAALPCAATRFKAVPLRRWPSMRFFAVRRQLTFTANLAAWLRNLTTDADLPSPPAAGHASPPFIIGDVPLPEAGPRDLVGFESPKRRDRDLISRWGWCLRSRENIRFEWTYPLGRLNVPFARRRSRSCGPPSGAGAWSATRPTALMGFLTLRRFGPDAGATPSPAPRACVPFTDRSPRFIFVAESSVRGELF